MKLLLLITLIGYELVVASAPIVLLENVFLIYGQFKLNLIICHTPGSEESAPNYACKRQMSRVGQEQQ